jgi:hypothetical protein
LDKTRLVTRCTRNQELIQSVTSAKAPNATDQLPGRPQGQNTSERRSAGPATASVASAMNIIQNRVPTVFFSFLSTL